jgi:group I intron endonuclease
MSESKCAVYAAIGPGNGIYIGISYNPDKRFKQHLSAAKNSKHPFAKAIQEHGPNKFNWQTIAWFDNRAEAAEMEQKLVNRIKSTGQLLYNATTGGECARFFDDTRARMSASKAGKPWSDKQRQSILKTVRSEKYREKCAARQRGKRPSAETLLKRSASVSAALTGHSVSLPTRRKLCAAVVNRNFLMSESDTRRNFCKLISPLDPVPVENMLTGDTGVGMPDVEFAGGWAELKNIKTWPSRKTTAVRIPHYTDAQRNWLMRRWNAGGYTCLVLQKGEEWFVWSAPAAQQVGTLTYMDLVATADLYFANKPSAEVFTRGMRDLVAAHDRKQQILTNPPSSR